MTIRIELGPDYQFAGFRGAKYLIAEEVFRKTRFETIRFFLFEVTGRVVTIEPYDWGWIASSLPDQLNLAGWFGAQNHLLRIAYSTVPATYTVEAEDESHSFESVYPRGPILEL